jgi:flagellar hook-associated protein 3 FlgL
MLNNTMLLNIMNNKTALSKYETQLSTGKKITKPSEDPIVAVRALRLRASVSEITQYKSNVDDANSWMTVTEKSMVNVNDILKRARGLTIQLSNGALGTTDMEKIVAELSELKNQVLQEGNTNYGGRFVFSGLKTDNGLVFTEKNTDTYEITEEFNNKNIVATQRVIDGTPPKVEDIYRVRLSYDQIASVSGTTLVDNAGVVINGSDGTPLTVVTVNSTDTNANKPATGDVHFVKDTGELIFNNVEGKTFSLNDNFNMKFTYVKNSFEKNQIKPEHYFDCIKKPDPLDNTTWSIFTKSAEGMNYQTGYMQTITINTLGRDVITTDLVRDFDEIINAIKNYTPADTELGVLQEEQLSRIAGAFISDIDKQLANTLEQISKSGSKLNRLILTDARLTDDEVNFTDLMSLNEDIDLAETIVKLTSHETVYNASLMASGRVIQTSLLDFIR